MRYNNRTITRPVDQVHRASDRDRNEDWWSLRDDTPAYDQSASDDRLNSQIDRLFGTAILTDVTPTMPACPVGQREPDLYEDGEAIWIGAEGVVVVDLEREPEVLRVALGSPRLRRIDEPNHCGFVRIPPERYGVRVEHFDGENPPADVAWRMLVETVSA